MASEAKVQMVAGALCCLIGLAAIAYYAVGKFGDSELTRHGVRTQGVVMGKEMGDHRSPGESRDRDRYTYTLDVSYSHPGGSRIGHFQTYRSDYARYQPGDRIEVLYDPRNPSLARLADGQDFRSDGMPLAIGIIFAGAGICVLLQARQMASDEVAPDAPDLEEALRKAQDRRKI
jgi:hypothetical protein